METNPMTPATDVPPRPVYEWTTVHGHDVRGANRGRAICTCGESQPVDESFRRVQRSGFEAEQTIRSERRRLVRAAQAWSRQHREQAWPILIPRAHGESLEALAERVERELEEARSECDESAVDLEVADGGAIPVMSKRRLRAGERAALLKHQHQQLCIELRDRPWRRDDHDRDGDRAKRYWAIRAEGDPFEEL